jgi:hypothetical protein
MEFNGESVAVPLEDILALIKRGMFFAVIGTNQDGDAIVVPFNRDDRWAVYPLLSSLR